MRIHLIQTTDGDWLVNNKHTDALEGIEKRFFEELKTILPMCLEVPKEIIIENYNG